MKVLVFLISLLFTTEIIAQTEHIHKISLGCEKTRVDYDEYGNLLPYGKEREGDYIYLRQQELDYITNRCLVGNGLLRGEFKIDKYILFNGQPVNTIWELKGHRFYITIDDLDNKQKLYYIIPKTELTSKNKKRY